MNEPSSSRFIFSAPFRTNIEMDNFSALEPAVIDNFINEVTGALNAPQGQANRWRSGRQQDKGFDLQFANLDEQMLPRIATPIAVLQVGTVSLQEVSQQVDVPFEGPEAIRTEGCSVRYYDNTIAVMVCVVTIERPPEEVLGVVDTWSTKLCESLIEALAVQRQRLEKALLATERKKAYKGLFAEPGKLRRFTDQNAGLKEDGHTMLWATRILVTATPPHDGVIARWTQTSVTSDDWLALGGASLLACIGNSVLAGDRSERELGIVRRHDCAMHLLLRLARPVSSASEANAPQCRKGCHKHVQGFVHSASALRPAESR